MVRGISLGAVALLCAAVGCSSKAEPDATCGGAAPYTVRGPYVAGVTTLEAGGVPVEVFYPAASAEGPRVVYDMRDWLPPDSRAKIPGAVTHQVDGYRGAPPSRGKKFPLVLFSHGLGGYRMQSSFLLSHLASWGFVVVAPEHPERGLAQVLSDLEKVEDHAPEQLKAAFEKVRGFEGIVDDTRVAVMGHSMGGAAATAMTEENGISTLVLLASPGFGASKKPVLMMGGTEDGFGTTESLDKAYERQPKGKRYVSIKGAGHLAFTDLCVIGRERGGLLQIAVDNGVEVNAIVQKLSRDGCEPDELRAEEAWPLVNHYVTAHLASQLGIDPAPRGFGDGASRCFGDRVASYREE
jgi:predicted dienelactone hydrolase